MDEATQKLYDNLPDGMKDVFFGKKKQEDEIKKEGKNPHQIIGELLEKIKQINKR